MLYKRPSPLKKEWKMTPEGDRKPMTKTEVTAAIAEATGLSKQQVGQVLDEVGGLIKQELGDGGPGVFTFHGLMKIKRVHKPATPERTGIDPFTKQEKVFKAKPASNTVKVQALKGLKDMV